MHDLARPQVVAVVGSRFASALLLILIVASVASAQGGADRIEAVRLEWLTQLARRDAAQWEIDLIAIPKGSVGSVASVSEPAAILADIRGELVADYGAIRAQLIALDTKARARREDVQRQWTAVVHARAGSMRRAETLEDAYGIDIERSSSIAFGLTKLDAVLLVCGLLVLLAARALAANERRLDRRRARRAAGALLVGMVFLAGCASGKESGQSRTDREEARLRAEAKKAGDAATATYEDADRRWRAAVDARAKLLAAPGTEVDALVLREEADVRGSLRRVTVETVLADRLARDAEDQRAAHGEEAARLDRLTSAAKGWAVAATGIRIAIAGGLFALCIAPVWSAVRANRAALRLAARQCPRCFKLNSLRVKRRAVVEEAKRYAKEPPSTATPESTRKIAVECQDCGLRLRPSDLRVRRLSFPVVGVPGCGKTHMLVTTFDSIQKGLIPSIAALQPASSIGDAGFEKRVERLVESHLAAGETAHELADPILFQLRDADPAGANSALVALFDYSGELLNDTIDRGDLRKSTLRMDGFLLFLDPTQLYGDDGRMTIKEQLDRLGKFLNEIRLERDIAPGGVIPAPVAVCISKLDLLVARSPIGGQAVHFLRHLTTKLNPGPKVTTPALLAERSELVEQMLPLLFPGLDVRAIVEGYFGKQMMFFPMTSVNLIESELGVADLSKRSVITPFGGAEPIVWLLHMQGYEMFST